MSEELTREQRAKIQDMFRYEGGLERNQTERKTCIHCRCLVVANCAVPNCPAKGEFA